MEELKHPYEMTPDELIIAIKLGQLSIETAEILIERGHNEYKHD